MEPRVATVSQMNGYIKKILDHNVILNNVWIKGEISNFKLHYSGHMYITLKDEKSVLKAVMFKSAVKNLAFTPGDGMKVLARGRVSVYEAGGAYQLYIEEMIPDGVGELYVAYEQLKAKLEQEGLFSPEYKKPVPAYPECVGVVTATTGAAVRDIINVISRRFPYSKILIYPSLVQGRGASENIVRAISYFNEHHAADTLIVGRGGGSIEDLWAFNEEIVARAIFASEIPVISAVGHETDFTIADFVADLRAPTPSAAAEISVPSQLELKNRITMFSGTLSSAMLKYLENRKMRLERMQLRSPEERIGDENLRLDQMVKRMEQVLKMRMLEQQKNLANLCGKMDALSPLAVMKRGYSIAQLEDGTVVRSAKQLEKEMVFDLKLGDGEKKCRVI